MLSHLSDTCFQYGTGEWSRPINKHSIVSGSPAVAVDVNLLKEVAQGHRFLYVCLPVGREKSNACQFENVRVWMWTCTILLGVNVQSGCEHVFLYMCGCIRMRMFLCGCEDVFLCR